MKLAKVLLPSGKESVALVEDETVLPLSSTTGQYRTLTEILDAEDVDDTVRLLQEGEGKRVPIDQCVLLPPLDEQEVWAAGVTYTRSRVARMEESQGGADFYDRVYVAPRPELFFKANPGRVVGPNRSVRIRQDSAWNVPEPELALVLNSRMEIVGYTIGNDVTSRDIEGENPLYLPQAKVYDGCCALGPYITLPAWMPSREKIGIRMAILRQGQIVFEGETSIARMARTFDDLIDYLGRDNTFRSGVVLLTGTGIVPDDKFTLRSGDTVDIRIDGIGTLSNTVVQG